MASRKKIGLILSGIGGAIYILAGIGFNYLLTYFGLRAGSLSFIITGVISLIGTGIGVKVIKIGGIIILSSIPLSLVIGVLFSSNLRYFPILLLFHQPEFILVIVGGILCLKASDSGIKQVNTITT